MYYVANILQCRELFVVLALTATTLGIRGVAQPDNSFMLASPGWSVVAWNDWLTYSLPTHWRFSDTDYPRLVGGPIE